MKSVVYRYFQLLLMLTGLTCCLSAQAAYVFKFVQYPGAVATQLSGVNESGQAVGVAFLDENGVNPPINFIYDVETGAFTDLPPYSDQDTQMSGINDLGETVGSAYPPAGAPPELGLIRNSNGTFMPFSHPAPLQDTFPRGVNDSGLITGFAQDDSGKNIVGFIYDAPHTSYVDLPFVGSKQVIPQGINASGQVVGSVRLPDKGLYSGYAPSHYGFLRTTDGAITLFQVSGADTRARGINDSDQITGFIIDTDGNASGFVGNLPDSFEALNVPGAIDTSPQAINNSGQIVGYTDSAGFVASSNKDQCKKGGWQSLFRADGTSFKNQGDCIQYVNTGK